MLTVLGKFLLVTGIVGIVALSACSSGEAEDREFDLVIQGQKLNLESTTLNVSQGDMVMLKFTSDETGSVHLHGYDIEKEVGPDMVTLIDFTADATGRFNFTFHPAGSEHSHEDGEHGHGDLFESDTLQNGDSFSYQIMQDMAEGMIDYHNHMHHEQTGMIMVSSAGQSGMVEVSILEGGAFEPADVTVMPGATVRWTNITSERQRIASGQPPEAASEGEHEEGESHEEEGEEVLLGVLEVRPR